MVIFGKPGWKPKNTLTFSISFLSLPKHLVISITLTLVAISAGMTQPSSHYLAIGIQAEQRHDSDIALRNYETAIRLSPSEPEAYWRASRLYSHRAGRSDNKALKEIYAVKANSLAGHSLMLNPGVVEARLALIISFAMLSEAASSPKEKLKNAFRIREEAEALLKMDSSFSPTYYVLGKWHYELSRLNWLERTACDLLFGGMPEGVSIEKSLHYFSKAVTLQPDYILFRYGKACALYDKGDYQATIKVLEETVRIPPSEPDDYVRLKKCEALLKKSNTMYLGKNI
jgi:tetratricopeptide (TPR) repeat protein